MKKKLTLLLLLVAFTFFSCGKTPPVDPTDTNVIGINGTISNFTKASDTSFEEGDQVGLFIVKTGNNTPVMLNGKFTYSSNEFKPETAQNWYTEEETSRVFSYYPYTSSLTEAFAAGKFTIGVKTDQSTHANYTASDFMAGVIPEVSPTSEKINITFKHLLTKVVVNIDNQRGETVVTALTISDIKGSVEYNFVDLSLAEEAITVTSLKFSTPNAGFSDSFAAIIPPQEAQPSLDITIDGKIYNVVVDDDVTLLSGKQLNINVVVEKGATPEEFIFTITTEIVDWEDDNELIFDIEN